MARKYVLLDDLDGNELPDDTTPTKLTFKGVTYSLYLSDASVSKLDDALEPFITDADTEETPRPRKSGVSGSKSKSDTPAIRMWAKANGYPVGDKGVIKPEIIADWKAAGSPGVGS